MSAFLRLWADDRGYVFSAELVLVATTLVIGLTVGLVSLRNQVVQELVDVGQSIGSLNQSYSFGGTGKPWTAWTGGSCYIDVIDFCQAPCQVPGTPPGGISVSLMPNEDALGPTTGELTEYPDQPESCPDEPEAWSEDSGACPEELVPVPESSQAGPEVIPTPSAKPAVPQHRVFPGGEKVRPNAAPKPKQGPRDRLL